MPILICFVFISFTNTIFALSRLVHLENKIKFEKAISVMPWNHRLFYIQFHFYFCSSIALILVRESVLGDLTFRTPLPYGALICPMITINNNITNFNFILTNNSCLWINECVRTSRKQFRNWEIMSNLSISEHMINDVLNHWRSHLQIDYFYIHDICMTQYQFTI